MKAVLTVLVAALLGLGAGACGGGKGRSGVPKSTASGMTSTSKTVVAATAGEPALTVDNDDDDNHPLPSEDNNSMVRDFGRPASAADRGPIAALVKRYYAAALAGDGAAACSMIEASLVRAVPLDYGQFGPAYLRAGKTCAAVLALLFAHEHSQLAVKTPRLKVEHVGIAGSHGLVLLAFAGMHEREIDVQRERGGWKIGALLDGQLQ